MSGTPRRPDRLVAAAHQACTPWRVPHTHGRGSQQSKCYIRGWMILCWGRWAAHRSIFSSTVGIYLVDASSMPPSVPIIKAACRHHLLSSGVQKWWHGTGRQHMFPRPAASASPWSKAAIENAGPVLNLLNPNLYFRKILTWFRRTLKFDKRRCTSLVLPCSLKHRNPYPSG